MRQVEAKRLWAVSLGLLLGMAVSVPAMAGTVVDAINSRGEIRCGVSQGTPGFSAPDSAGNWKGLDVEICEALAVAMFNDKSKVDWISLQFSQVFPALNSGDIDLINRSILKTVGRDVDMGLEYPGVTYFSGQTFMVPKALNVTEPQQLNGATICVLGGTGTQATLNDYFREKGFTYTPAVFEDQDLMYQAYEQGRCDAVTTEPPILASRRSVFQAPDDHLIMEELISKEIVGPIVKHGDDEWRDLVKIVLWGLVALEEEGITQANAAKLRKTATKPEVRRMLGLEGELGKGVGLRTGWLADVAEKIGNYGEVYERNVGPNTPLGLKRGLNATWKDGGLMIAPPFR